jgi:hypothetical protein
MLVKFWFTKLITFVFKVMALRLEAGCRSVAPKAAAAKKVISSRSAIRIQASLTGMEPVVMYMISTSEYQVRHLDNETSEARKHARGDAEDNAEWDEECTFFNVCIQD